MKEIKIVSYILYLHIFSLEIKIKTLHFQFSLHMFSATLLNNIWSKYKNGKIQQLSHLHWF